MKMFHIPDPWDYHESGGYVVMASTKEAAIKKVKKLVPENSYYKGSRVQYDKITEVEGGVFTTSGCDC